MEKVPSFAALPAALPTLALPVAQGVTTTDWRRQLPVLSAGSVTLRGLRPGDAESLCQLLTAAEVACSISPPPTTVEGFAHFIAWVGREQAAGRHVCFAVVPAGTDTAVGLFQVRQLDADFQNAEWGFVLGSAYWGTGLFADGAPLVIDFALDTVGVNRLEARAAVFNGRGNGALAKVGAVREGRLRQSFERDGQYHDQHLWSIVASDRRAAREVIATSVH